MDTRGWMGGVSRREILSMRPEIFFFRAVSETSLNVPRSSAFECVKGYTKVEGCQAGTCGDAGEESGGIENLVLVVVKNLSSACVAT